MTHPRRRTAATWGLVIAGTVGAVGVTAFAVDQARVDDLTFTDSAGATAFFDAPVLTTTTTTQAPGLNGSPVKKTAAGAGSHTKAHGS